MTVKWKSAIVLLTIFVSTCVEKGRGYRITLRKNSDLNIQLFWEVNYNKNRVVFTLDISGPTVDQKLSTIGFGMSDRGYVTNADLVMIHRDGEGVEIQDSWSNESGLIYSDEEQDYHLIEYDVSAGHVSVRVWRQFDTHDEHDYRLDNGTTNIFYLLDNTDESSGAPPSVVVFSRFDDMQPERIPEFDAKLMEHDVVQVQLLKPEIPESYLEGDDPKDILTFDILQPNISIPFQVTTYWCSLHKLPDVVSHKKVHGIGFGAAISEESESIAHHIEVFLCDPKDGKVSEFSGLCGAKDEPEDVRHCNRVLAAWAKGADVIMYPKEAGFPLGGVGESRYVRLEVHYHNPNNIEGIVDSSGIRFFYTKKLRKYDAGVLEVGVTYNNNLAIPPGQRDFVLSGICPAKCTAKGIVPGGINVFASQLHAHLAGRKIWISRYRAGEKPLEMNRDDHYDALFEEIRQIYPPVKILPGDSIATSCSYSTINRRNVTTTGGGMFDEMCGSYLHYYPLSPLEMCKSSTSTSALEEFFIIERIFTGSPSPLNFTDLGENYHSMKWGGATTSNLKTTYRNAAQEIECRQHSGRQLPGAWEDMILL